MAASLSVGAGSLWPLGGGAQDAVPLDPIRNCRVTLRAGTAFPFEAYGNATDKVRYGETGCGLPELIMSKGTGAGQTGQTWRLRRKLIQVPWAHSRPAAAADLMRQAAAVRRPRNSAAGTPDCRYGRATPCPRLAADQPRSRRTITMCSIQYGDPPWPTRPGTALLRAASRLPTPAKNRLKAWAAR